MSELETLLLVQDRDTHIDQLRHRREHLPAHADLAAVQRQQAELAPRLTEVSTRLAAIVVDQSEREAELASTEARIAEIDKRLTSGGAGFRDLERMQTEIAHLKERQSVLEDDVLAFMDLREPIEIELETITIETSRLSDEAIRLAAEIAGGQAEVDAELAAEVEARAGLEATIGDELRAEYERLRAHLGGVGVARLVNGACAGCHLALSASELAHIKKLPPDEFAHCEQCSRILIA